VLRSGTVVNTSPELRDLKSNVTLLNQITERTGGRVISPFKAESVALFDRAGLIQRNAPMPVWDLILPFLIGLLLLDVAVRRIAWDLASIQKAYAGAIGYIKSFTTTRKVETTESLDALRRVRSEKATKTEPTSPQKPAPSGPVSTTKFEAQGDVQGDITNVVGGASDKPLPPPPKKIEPKGAPATGSHTGSLLEAKRRAQQQIRDKEEGK